MALSITVSKEDFLPALNSLQSITGKKGTMAILANVLIQTHDNFIELIATDLEVGMKKSVAAEIVSPGSITLPSKILYEIVREAGSDSIKQLLTAPLAIPPSAARGRFPKAVTAVGVR